MTKHQEYPKAVYPNGNFTVVHDADHEERVMATVQPIPEETPEPASDKEALVTEAESLGIEVDRRWGVARLRAEIEAAKP